MHLFQDPFNTTTDLIDLKDAPKPGGGRGMDTTWTYRGGSPALIRTGGYLQGSNTAGLGTYYNNASPDIGDVQVGILCSRNEAAAQLRIYAHYDPATNTGYVFRFENGQTILSRHNAGVSTDLATNTTTAVMNNTGGLVAFRCFVGNEGSNVRIRLQSFNTVTGAVSATHIDFLDTSGSKVTSFGKVMVGLLGDARLLDIKADTINARWAQGSAQVSYEAFDGTGEFVNTFADEGYPANLQWKPLTEGGGFGVMPLSGTGYVGRSTAGNYYTKNMGQPLSADCFIDFVAGRTDSDAQVSVFARAIPFASQPAGNGSWGGYFVGLHGDRTFIYKIKDPTTYELGSSSSSGDILQSGETRWYRFIVRNEGTGVRCILQEMSTDFGLVQRTIMSVLDPSNTITDIGYAGIRMNGVGSRMYDWALNDYRSKPVAAGSTTTANMVGAGLSIKSGVMSSVGSSTAELIALPVPLIHVEAAGTSTAAFVGEFTQDSEIVAAGSSTANMDASVYVESSFEAAGEATSDIVPLIVRFAAMYSLCEPPEPNFVSVEFVTNTGVPRAAGTSGGNLAFSRNFDMSFTGGGTSAANMVSKTLPAWGMEFDVHGGTSAAFMVGERLAAGVIESFPAEAAVAYDFVGQRRAAASFSAAGGVDTAWNNTTSRTFSITGTSTVADWTWDGVDQIASFSAAGTVQATFREVGSSFFLSEGRSFESGWVTSTVNSASFSAAGKATFRTPFAGTGLVVAEISAAGSSTGVMIQRIIVPFDIAIEGTSTAEMFVSDLKTGVPEAEGTSTAEFEGQWLARIDAAGEAVVDGIGSSVAEAEIESDGTSTAEMEGSSVAAAEFAVEGISAADFPGISYSIGDLETEGTSTADMPGSAGAVTEIEAEGTSTAEFVGERIAAGRLVAAGTTPVAAFVGSRLASVDFEAYGVNTFAVFTGAFLITGTMAAEGTSTAEMHFPGFEFEAEGTSTAEFAAEAIVAAEIEAEGTSLADAIGEAIVEASFEAEGTSEALFAGEITVEMEFEAEGTSEAEFVGRAVIPFQISSSAEAVVEFFSLIASDLRAEGTSTAEFEGSSVSSSSFEAEGTSTSAMEALSDFLAEGLSEAEFEGGSIAEAEFTAEGTSTGEMKTGHFMDSKGVAVAEFVGEAFVEAEIEAAGTSDGEMVAIVGITAEGTSTAEFVGELTAAADMAAEGTSTADFAGIAAVVGEFSAEGTSETAFDISIFVGADISSDGVGLGEFVGSYIAEAGFETEGTSDALFEGITIAGGDISSDGTSIGDMFGSGVIDGVMEAEGLSGSSFIGLGVFPATFDIGGSTNEIDFPAEAFATGDFAIEGTSIGFFRRWRTGDPTPLDRIVFLSAEDRLLRLIAEDNKVMILNNDDRTVFLGAESRTVFLPKQL